jgi:hypothetical protein
VSAGMTVVSCVAMSGRSIDDTLDWCPVVLPPLSTMGAVVLDRPGEDVNWADWRMAIVVLGCCGECEGERAARLVLLGTTRDDWTQDT